MNTNIIIDSNQTYISRLDKLGRCKAMRVEQVIETLRTSPESWKIIFQNTDSIVFAWGDYRFTRLSDRFNCAMMLNSKYNEINFNWTADDPFISRLYSGLIRQHLRVGAAPR